MGSQLKGILSRRKRALQGQGGLTPAQGPNGAACRMAGVNERGQ
jgi:hypothetical protein